MTVSLDAQIAAVRTAAQFATSATERAILKQAATTLERVKREEATGRAAIAAISEAVRGTR